MVRSKFFIVLFIGLIGLLAGLKSLSAEEKDPKSIGVHTGVKTMVQFDLNKDGSFSAFIHQYNDDGSYPRSGYISVREGLSEFPLDIIKQLKRSPRVILYGYFILDYEITGEMEGPIANYPAKVLKAVQFIPPGKRTWYDRWITPDYRNQ